ncbi:MAG: M56 family metallopeptidase [Christiangramia sp.]
MLHYILQILFFQLFFLLVYEIFLKKETFFNYNRIYLLVTPILAFLIPWLRLEFLVEAVPENARIIIPQVISSQPDIYRETLPTVTIYGESGLQLNWWLIFYLIGFTASMFLFIRKYRNLNKLFSFRQITREKNFRIIEVPDSNAAYTFLNTVFLGDQLSDSEKQHILSHELVHVKQKHSLDLIFFEILKVVFWFNPLIYIYQNRIAGLHEFIADDEVVKTTERKTYYEQLLNTAFNTQNISFLNQFFNHSLIKKRIFMLQKNKSSKLSKFKFLLVIPLMLAMLTYVACSEDRPNEAEPESQKTTTSEIIAELKADLENKESLSKEEKEQFLDLLNKRQELLVAEGYSKYEAGRPDNSMYDGKPEVPFAVIDKAPAFAECDQWVDDPRRNCTSSKISNYVNENFDTSLGKKLGLTGVNRVIVQFRIDETGKIVDIKARASHPELEKEAKRVIGNIPDMVPGEQNGKPVSVMYSLPIAFQVGE